MVRGHSVRPLPHRRSHVAISAARWIRFALGANLTSDPKIGFMFLALIADAIIFAWLLKRGRDTDACKRHGCTPSPGSLLDRCSHTFRRLSSALRGRRTDASTSRFAVASCSIRRTAQRCGLHSHHCCTSPIPAQAPRGLHGTVVSVTLLLMSWGPNAWTFLASRGNAASRSNQLAAHPTSRQFLRLRPHYGLPLWITGNQRGRCRCDRFDRRPFGICPPWLVWLRPLEGRLNAYPQATSR